MRIKQLIDKLTGILSDEHHQQMEKYKSLKKVLKSLRKEQKLLEDELGKIEDPNQREYIEGRLKIITAQRKKGLEVLKKLKQERNG